MNQSLTQQRIRITFGKHGALRFIGHLDLARTWERVLRRARIPLEYSQGFNPRPRLQFATALPVGVTSESEYLDAWLLDRLEGDFPDGWIEVLSAASPEGLRTYDLAEVPVNDAALPTQVTYSEFVITPVDDDLSPVELQARADALLKLDTIERMGKKRPYDLRPRIFDLSVDSGGNLIAILSSNERANARPDEVLDAMCLGMDQARVHRRRLHLGDAPPAP